MAEGGGIGRNFGDTVGMFFFFFFRNSWRTTNQLKLVGHIIPIFSNLHFTLFFGDFWRGLEGLIYFRWCFVVSETVSVSPGLI